MRLIYFKKSLGHGRMTSLSDTLTVGLVLVLLFGSIALYLYTRIQQAEQKISLLESILLEVKMSAEIKSYSELPAATRSMSSTETQQAGYMPFHEDDIDEDNTDSPDNYYPGAIVGQGSQQQQQSKSGSSTPSVSGSVNDTSPNEVDQYKSAIASAVSNNDSELEVEPLPAASKVSANYESMTLKELQTLAKTRGITGAGSMKKGAIIEALKTSDRSSSAPEPGSGPVMGSFLETSSPFPGPVVASANEIE